MNDCEFVDKGKCVVCRRCNTKRKARVIRNCHASCKNLGEALPAWFHVKCIGCGGVLRTVRHQIFVCDIVGVCSPTYRCDPKAITEQAADAPHVCFGCDYFEGKSNGAPE